MKSCFLFGMVVAVLAPTVISLQCLTGYDITASAATTFPVGKYSTMTNCSAENDACVRITATGNMLGFSVTGLGYLCAPRSNCTFLSGQCSANAQNILNTQATITSCQLKCCFTDNCNSQPIGGGSETNILRSATVMLAAVCHVMFWGSTFSVI